MKILKFICFISLLIAIFNIHLYCKDFKTLSLNQYIGLVLEKNLNIKSYKLNKEINRFNMEKYIANFDPHVKLSASRDYNKEFTGSILQSSNSPYTVTKNSNINFDLSKKFFTGTNLDISLTNNRYKTNSNWSILNPSYSSELILTINQPILKNFGITINKTEILKAENQFKKTENDVKDYINSQILKASYNYFDLIYFYKYLQLTKEFLKLALNTDKINRKKYSVGLLPKTILTESKAEILSRRKEVIIAEEKYYNILDELKNSINDIKSDYIIIPATKPFNVSNEFSLEDGIKSALKNRLELKKINYDIKNADIDKNFAKNQLLPSLNLNIYGGLSGKGGNFNTDYKRLRSNNYNRWGIGITLSYPLGNRDAKAELQIKKLTLQQLKYQKQSMKNQIISEVKKSYRRLLSLIKKINANKKAYESASEKLKVEEKKYRNGLSDIFKVFSYQTDYINEKTELLKAQTDYSKEVINWRRITGKKLFKIN